MVRKALQVLDKGLSWFEEWTLFLTVTAALLTLFVSVVTRYTMTYTMTWPEELVREVIVYSTFVGCAAAVKRRGNIRVDAVPNLFPRLAKGLDAVSHVALLLFAGFITWYGVKLVKLQIATKQATIILKIPQSVLYSIIVLMGVTMICRLAHVLYEDLTGTKVAD